MCSARLSPRMRGHARYCSTRCRVAAHRARTRLPKLPPALTDRPRWVRHDKFKVPMTAWGSAASSVNPATWCDYDTAVASDVGAGLGFVLNGDGIVCLDLDHCFVDGELSPVASALVAACGNTYMERSPSGDGLHIWGTAKLDFRGRKFPGVEVYGDVRYMTVTGDALTPVRTLAPLTAVIAAL